MITTADLEHALDQARRDRRLTSGQRLVLLALACWGRRPSDSGVDVLGPIDLPALDEAARRTGLRQARVAAEVYGLLRVGWLRTVGLGLVEIVPGGDPGVAR